MRIVGIVLCFFLGLVVLSVVSFLFAITAYRVQVVSPRPMAVEVAPGGMIQHTVTTADAEFPYSSIEMSQTPATAEAVPGQGSPAPYSVVTHTEMPPNHARVGFALLPLCLIVLLVVGGMGLVVRLTRSNGKASSLANTEEIRMMQEIHQGLSGLERRVESLETLLLDRAVIRDGEEWKRS